MSVVKFALTFFLCFVGIHVNYQLQRQLGMRYYSKCYYIQAAVSEIRLALNLDVKVHPWFTERYVPSNVCFSKNRYTRIFSVLLPVCKKCISKFKIILRSEA